MTLDYVYNCTGDGTHIYQTVTNGYAAVNGTGAEASAYDYLPNASC